MNVKVHHAAGATKGNERWTPTPTLRAMTPSVRAIGDLLDETVEEAQTVPYSSHVCRLLDDVESDDVDDTVTEYGARQAGIDYAAVALLRPPVLPPRRCCDDEPTDPTALFERAPVEARIERPPAPKPARRSGGARADDDVPELLPLPMPVVERGTRARPSRPSLAAADEREAIEDPSDVDESSWSGPVMLSPLDPRHLVPGGALSRGHEHLASLRVEARSVAARLAALLVDTGRLAARIGSVPIPVAWTLAAFMLGVVVSQLVSVL